MEPAVPAALCVGAPWRGLAIRAASHRSSSWRGWGSCPAAGRS